MRLSCGAKPKCSQTEFYYTVLQEVHRIGRGTGAGSFKRLLGSPLTRQCRNRFRAPRPKTRLKFDSPEKTILRLSWSGGVLLPHINDFVELIPQRSLARCERARLAIKRNYPSDGTPECHEVTAGKICIDKCD